MNIDSKWRELPKVELHRHLEGALRFSTLCELAPQVGIELPTDIEQKKQALLVREPMKDLTAVLNKFLTSQHVLYSEEILSRITYECIEDAYREGIRILELRYSPTYIHQGHDSLNFEKIHRSILKGIDQAKRLPISVGLIGIIQRILPLESANFVTDFIIDHKETFVGIDLADDEVSCPTLSFASCFAKARKAGLHVTVHSGEANVPGIEKNVKDAIEHLGAERIGHGVQIYKNEEILRFVKANKVALELCPTSNWLTNAVSNLRQHPFKILMDQGVLTTINSDDPGIFDIDLNNEYQVLADHHGLTLADFEKCNDTAAQVSFLPLQAKQKNWPREIS